ncbi:MAG: hypothetical protein ACYDBV_01040 [Nitrospiria bacterium]
MFHDIVIRIKESKENPINIPKSRIENLRKDLPDEVDTEEVMYRLYLLEKIEAGEADIKGGKVLSHSEAMNRLSKK